MSLEVYRSHDDEYVLLKNIEFDDTPIKKIEEGCRELYNMATWVFILYTWGVVGECRKHIWVEDG